MPEVVYSCPYVPAEWIAAHGLKPSRVTPSFPPPSGPVAQHAGICPYMRAFINTVCSDPDTDCIVLATSCDQMRRATDIIAMESGISVFLMQVPHVWNCPAARELYLSELRRLGQFLVTRGGNPPNAQRLAHTMHLYDRARARLRTTRDNFSSGAFSKAIDRFHRNGTVELPPDGPFVSEGMVPIALLGGPLTFESFGIFHLIAQYGGSVVLNATESGEMTLPAPFDRRRLADDPLRELARAYYETIPAPFLRPDTGLHEWIAREACQRSVKGLILIRYLWCDTWHVEVQRFRERLDVPVLDIDLGGEDAPVRFTTRIQAFIENLT